jgi:hypothetical protein
MLPDLLAIILYPLAAILGHSVRCSKLVI